MDIDRFLKLLEDPGKSKADLLTMRANAIEKNAVEYIHLSEKVLNQRFPGWQVVRTRRGGSKPTDVMFMNKFHHFDTEKDAYVWLIERFIQHYPQPFEAINWETKFIAKGVRTIYFSRSLDSLFRTSPAHAADPTKYVRLTNSWYAKLVLSEDQKVDLLMKFAAVANLKMGMDWDWAFRWRDGPDLSIGFDLEDSQE